MKTYFNKIKVALQAFWKDPLFLHVWDQDMYYARRGVQDNRLHKNIYGGYSHESYYLRSDTHMLIEDLYTGVMPYLNHRRAQAGDPSFSFSVALDAVRQRMVAAGISDRNGGFDFTGAISDFIREATRQLMTYGVVYYELVYESTGGQISSFSLDSIPNGYLFRIFGNYYQVIPWWVASRTRNTVGIIKIPGDKVLKIDFPKSLGGKRKLFRILKRLYKLSRDIFPAFTMAAMEAREDTGFDSNEFAKDRYLEVARITRVFGWNQRNRKNAYTTEFHTFKRLIDSYEINLIFRESILTSLNAFLNGPIINLSSHIKPNGFMTRERIKDWRKKMEVGGLKFIDVFQDLKEI